MAAEKDARKPPEWLNEDFVAKDLQKGLNEPLLQVLSWDIKPAVAVGDNYSSVMFRAVMQIKKAPSTEEERLSIVMKTMPKVSPVFQELANMAFATESKMMQEILPEMNSRLKELNPDCEQLNARCFWAAEEPEPFLFLEDLKELGFGLADRMNGLDASTTNMVLDSLAKFHAASLAIAQDQPQKLAEFERNPWLKNKDIGIWINGGLDGLIEEASHWQDFPKDYIQKLIDLRPVFVDRMRAVLAKDPSDLNVLVHGDCWINNMMVYPDKGPVTTLRFVDFQMSMMNSPAIDLTYFIFTSPNSSIRLNIEEMLARYHTVFIENVKKLGVRMDRSFTLDDLTNDFRKRAAFGFFALVLVYPITITEKKDVKDPHEFFDEEKSKRSSYQSSTFKKMFQLVMPYFVDCGLFH